MCARARLFLKMEFEQWLYTKSRNITNQVFFKWKFTGAFSFFRVCLLVKTINNSISCWMVGGDYAEI